MRKYTVTVLSTVLCIVAAVLYVASLVSFGNESTRTLGSVFLCFGSVCLCFGIWLSRKQRPTDHDDEKK